MLLLCKNVASAAVLLRSLLNKRETRRRRVRAWGEKKQKTDAGWWGEGKETVVSFRAPPPSISCLAQRKRTRLLHRLVKTQLHGINDILLTNALLAPFLRSPLQVRGTSTRKQ